MKHEDIFNINDVYVDDSPIDDPKLDRLKRRPFAERIAKTIASRLNPASLVIGIYGAWGDGKTTVLNFIEKELKKDSHVICIRFNPWRFEDESGLLLSFFKTLESKLTDQSLGKKTTQVKEAFQKYGKALLYSTSINLGLLKLIGLNFDLDKFAEFIGDLSADLVEQRNKIETYLNDIKKRIVIFIDDIDRLDKTETQTLFKLLKLTADFPYIVYVLAFDPEVVAGVLEEKYPSSDKSTKDKMGQNFLEKIVQVPLRLPMVDSISLRDFCLDGVTNALHAAEIELSEDQYRRFGRHFAYLERRIRTPRMCKRYANALAFSLPLLKADVYPVDLMLIEGIRVFYPKLYEVVREHPEVFLKDASLRPVYDMPKEQLKELKRRNEKIIFDEGLVGLSSDDMMSARKLLDILFPRLSEIREGMSWAEHIYDKLTTDKSIGSNDYFNRYFFYTAVKGDISDHRVTELIRELEEGKHAEEIAAEIRMLTRDRDEDKLVTKLRERIEKMPPNPSRNLALAIAEVGDVFPDNKTAGIPFTSTFLRAADLVSQLVKNIPKEQSRFSVAQQIAEKGEPIAFASECVNAILIPPERGDEEIILSEEEAYKLDKILKDRIQKST